MIVDRAGDVGPEVAIGSEELKPANLPIGRAEAQALSHSSALRLGMFVVTFLSTDAPARCVLASPLPCAGRLSDNLRA